VGCSKPAIIMSVVVLPEPLGALDKNLREQMQVEITRIHRAVGITTVYVTHDQTEAMTMSDRVVVMNRGRIEQAAPPLTVYEQPATRFVAEFVGDSNVVRAEVEASGRVRLPGLGVTLDIPGASPGSVHALIRPERLRLLAAGAPREELTIVTMKVASFSHFGDSVLLTGTAGTETLRVRVPDGRVRVREGEEIQVGWRADDIHLIGGQ
jgi:putative spermidine/putrescine transport system ATP-binding protein